MHSTNKKFSLNNFKKIYLMAPPNVSTGGPEALHQLGYILKNNLKKNIQIFYYPNTDQNPVHKNYEKYSLDFTDIIEDSPENLIIIPEYFNFLLKTLDYKKIKKVIWWLSIDNYIGSRFRFANNKFLRSLYKIPFNLINFFNYFTNFLFGILTIEEYLKFLYSFKNFNKHKEIEQAHFHVVQSNYAYNYLKKRFDLIEYLSDFLRDDIFNVKFSSLQKKENIICYNPQKSNQFMNLLIKKTNFKFIPLINLDNEKIVNTLLKSKIYIDIGSHPGKDRLPREAAILGNCILTNLKGSAANSEDISIPNNFKFKENISNLNKIENTINLIFNDYENEYKKFDLYVEKILKEKETFIKEVNKIFQ